MIDESHFPPRLEKPNEKSWKAYRLEVIQEIIKEGFDASAWIDLCAHLAWAAKLDRKNLSAKSYNDRIAVQYALRRVIVYLEKSKFIKKHGGSGLLQRLHIALSDLDVGKVRTVVKPLEKKNPGYGVPDSIIGLAAKTMDELMKAGDTREQAALKVALALQRYPKVRAATVARWRDGCNEGPGGRVSAKAIAQYRAPLPPELANNPEAGEILLKMLRESLV